MDSYPARATLFLHEDILARTLDYEEDLYDWRVAELEAGRSDPGRPEYDEASVGFNFIGVLPYQYFRFLEVYQARHTDTTFRTHFSLFSGTWAVLKV